MANTTVWGGKFLHIVFDGSTDWDLTTEAEAHHEEYVHGLNVMHMQVVPTGTDDVITVRNTKVANTESAIIIKEKFSSEYDTPRRTFRPGGQWMFPAIDASEVSAGVTLIIEIE